MKSINYYLQERSVYIGGNSYSSDSNRIAAYNDLTPEERKQLDDYCQTKVGKNFKDCSFEEQSTARSTLWTNQNNPDEIEKQDTLNKNM